MPHEVITPILVVCTVPPVLPTSWPKQIEIVQDILSVFNGPAAPIASQRRRQAVPAKAADAQVREEPEGEATSSLRYHECTATQVAKYTTCLAELRSAFSQKVIDNATTVSEIEQAPMRGSKLAGCSGRCGS